MGPSAPRPRRSSSTEDRDEFVQMCSIRPRAQPRRRIAAQRYVIRVTGRPPAPRGRQSEPVSGEIEVLAHDMRSSTPRKRRRSADDENPSETVRLQHQVIDLRRPPMQRNVLRHRAAMAARNYLDAQGFSTSRRPCSTSHARGAREFRAVADPPGMFYALPQSPQLFKQMLMIAGFDRYYQIVKCSRRRPARRPPAGIHADRHRDVVPGRARDPRHPGRLVRRCSRKRSASSCPIRFRDAVRGCDARLRLGQARLAHSAQADRAHRSHAHRRLQGLRAAAD